MRRLVGSAMIVVLFFASAPAKDCHASPKVQVYSRTPQEFGKPNTLICHVSGFHPPEISIELLKNGDKMEDSHQTDLAFEESWQYHLTTHATFTPNKEDKYSCRVTHLKTTNMYIWDPNM